MFARKGLPQIVVLHALVLICLSRCSISTNCRGSDISCSLIAWLTASDFQQDWLVAVGTLGYAYYSNDGGRTWTAGATGGPGDLTGVVYAGNRRWIATGPSDRMIYSDDGGKTWSNAPGPSTAGVNHQALAFGNGVAMAVGTVANIFLSTDRGLNWVSTTTPVAAVKNNADFLCGKLIFASNAQVAYSSDGTNAIVSTSLPNFPTGKGACVNGRMVIATGSAPYSYYSNDQAVNWIAGGAGIGAIRRAVRLMGNQMFAFGDDLAVYTSTDASSWTSSTSIPVGNIKDAVAMTSLRMIAVGGVGTPSLIYTENGAASWTQVSGFPAFTFSSIAFARIPNP